MRRYFFSALILLFSRALGQSQPTITDGSGIPISNLELSIGKRYVGESEKVVIQSEVLKLKVTSTKDGHIRIKEGRCKLGASPIDPNLVRITLNSSKVLSEKAATRGFRVTVKIQTQSLPAGLVTCDHFEVIFEKPGK